MMYNEGFELFQMGKREKCINGFKVFILVVGKCKKGYY